MVQEMLKMEPIYHTRYEFNEKGKSLRQISRETGHDRQTVKKFVEQEDFNKPDPMKRRRSSKTDQYRDRVRGWLINDQTAPRKQRHTAHRVYHRLMDIEERQGREITVLRAFNPQSGGRAQDGIRADRHRLTAASTPRWRGPG